MAEWLIADVPLFNIHVQLGCCWSAVCPDLVSLRLGDAIVLAEVLGRISRPSNELCVLLRPHHVFKT